jgi:hypothetical protein
MQCGQSVRLGALMVIGLMVAPVATIAAQQAPPVKAGDRVRVIAPGVSGSPFVGAVVALEADSLVVHDSMDTWRLSLASVEKVDLSQGRKSHALLGAGIGFVVGGGVAIAVLYTGGSTSLCDQSANQDAMNSGECIGLTALGGAAGAGLGAIIGGLIRTERWQNIPLERLRVSLSPQAGGRLGLALAVVL